MPTPIDVCFLTISSLLFLMYVVFLVSLVAHQNLAPLRSGFYALTFSLGVYDVLQMFHVYFFLRFPSFGWMTDDVYLHMPAGLVHYGSCAMWALACNQHLTVVFIALNRLSAIVFPHEHKRRWRGSVVKTIVFGIAVSGLLFVMPKMVASSAHYYMTNNRTRAITIVWDDQGLLFSYKYASTVILSIACSICFVAYFWIFYVSVKRHMSVAKRRTIFEHRVSEACSRRTSSITMTLYSPQSCSPPRKASLVPLATAINGIDRAKLAAISAQCKSSGIRAIAKKVSIRAQAQSTNLVVLWEKRELKLAVCGFIIFVFMFLYTVGVVNMGVDESAGRQLAHRSIWLASSDLFCGINPLLLIAVSSTLRSRFFSILCCSCCERHYSSPPHSFINDI